MPTHKIALIDENPQQKEGAQTHPPLPTNVLHKVDEVMLAECKGTRTIILSKDVFSGYIDSTFDTLKGNCATPIMQVDVYEMNQNARFPKIFGSFGRELNVLIFTQDQVIEFCTKYPRKLRTGSYGTFFLLKEGNNFFVARVYFNDDGWLEVRFCVFEYYYIWGACYRRRVVVPQL